MDFYFILVYKFVNFNTHIVTNIIVGENISLPQKNPPRQVSILTSSHDFWQPLICSDCSYFPPPRMSLIWNHIVCNLRMISFTQQNRVDIPTGHCRCQHISKFLQVFMTSILLDGCNQICLSTQLMNFSAKVLFEGTFLWELQNTLRQAKFFRINILSLQLKCRNLFTRQFPLVSSFFFLMFVCLFVFLLLGIACSFPFQLLCGKLSLFF